MAQQDDGLLREVEEELRRERLEKIWKQYGTYILAAAAVDRVWRARLQVLGELRASPPPRTSGARYEEALLLVNDKKEGSAEKEFEKIAVDGAGGYRALAQLQLAGSQAKQGKKAEAVATYEALANDGSADAMLRDFARLQAAGLRIGEADFTEIENRLTPLMGDTSPWRYQCARAAGAGGVQGRQVERGTHHPDAAVRRPVDAAEHHRAGPDRDGGDRSRRDRQEIASNAPAAPAAPPPASPPTNAAPPAGARRRRCRRLKRTEWGLHEGDAAERRDGRGAVARSCCFPVAPATGLRSPSSPTSIPSPRRKCRFPASASPVMQPAGAGDGRAGGRQRADHPAGAARQRRLGAAGRCSPTTPRAISPSAAPPTWCGAPTPVTGSGSVGRITASPLVYNGQRLHPRRRRQRSAPSPTPAAPPMWRTSLKPKRESSGSWYSLGGGSSGGGYGGGLAIDGGTALCGERLRQRRRARSAERQVDLGEAARGAGALPRRPRSAIACSSSRSTAASSASPAPTAASCGRCADCRSRRASMNNASPAVDGDIVVVPYPSGDLVAMQRGGRLVGVVGEPRAHAHDLAAHLDERRRAPGHRQRHRVRHRPCRAHDRDAGRERRAPMVDQRARHAGALGRRRQRVRRRYPGPAHGAVAHRRQDAMDDQAARYRRVGGPDAGRRHAVAGVLGRQRSSASTPRPARSAARRISAAPSTSHRWWPRGACTC